MNIKQAINSSYKTWFAMNNFYEEWAKQYDLTSNSLLTLYLINQSHTPLTQKDIASELYLSKQTVNSILNNLEKRQLIQRQVSDENKREKKIVFTVAGKEFAKSVLAHLDQHEYEAFSQLDDTDRKHLVNINEKLLTALTNNRNDY